MKKIIFLLLFSISFLKSEPITAINGYCVDNYYYNGSTVYYLVSNNHFGTNYQATSFSSNVYYQILLNEGKYTLNENGNVVIENRCYSKNGTLNQAMGEAFIENPPFNSKLKVSFLPEGIRWLPVGRGDYWILKIDEDYQTVLVGEPERKYMWVLSRTAHPDEAVIQHYLDYAKTLGYRLNDVIRSKHRKQ